MAVCDSRRLEIGPSVRPSEEEMRGEEDEFEREKKEYAADISLLPRKCDILIRMLAHGNSWE